MTFCIFWNVLMLWEHYFSTRCALDNSAKNALLHERRGLMRSLRILSCGAEMEWHITFVFLFSKMPHKCTMRMKNEDWNSTCWSSLNVVGSCWRSARIFCNCLLFDTVHECLFFFFFFRIFWCETMRWTTMSHNAIRMKNLTLLATFRHRIASTSYSMSMYESDWPRWE